MNNNSFNINNSGNLNANQPNQQPLPQNNQTMQQAYVQNSQSVHPAYTQSNQSAYNPYGVQQPQYQTQPTNTVDPMAAVASLNKEEAMEEALSHTNQYTPFEVPKQEVSTTSKKENSKSAYILLGVILGIMALFIFFLPQISKLFGW